MSAVLLIVSVMGAPVEARGLSALIPYRASDPGSDQTAWTMPHKFRTVMTS